MSNAHNEGSFAHDRILCDCGKRAMYGWPYCAECADRYPRAADFPAQFVRPDSELDDLFKTSKGDK